jgi:signal transduction histidine kinase
MAAGQEAAAPPRPPLAYRMTRGQRVAADSAVAAAAALVVAFDAGLLHGWHGHVPTAVTAGAALFGAAPVAVRRIWPAPVLAVVAATCCALIVRDGRVPNLLIVMLGMAVYTTAVRCRRKVAVAALAVVALALGAAVLAAVASGRSEADVGRSLLVAGSLWFIGDSVRERRRFLRGQAEQAAQRHRAETERGRQAVREERVRIARELHDVVAHSLSVVTVQAGVGRRVEAVRPGEALRALRAVEVTGRGALEELRRILGLLRDEAEGASLAPAPGIEDLGELAATVRAAGIPVALDVTGDAAALPPAAALTVYRIVQEALTNVVKHAGRAAAQVRVRAGQDGIRITVTDNGVTGPGVTGPGAPGTAPGTAPETTAGALPAVGGADRHGIVGMRERAAAFGGTLDAGPLPGGGFGVSAFLPVRAAAGQATR